MVVGVAVVTLVVAPVDAVAAVALVASVLVMSEVLAPLLAGPPLAAVDALSIGSPESPQPIRTAANPIRPIIP
ncbi:hypothetical protein OV079_28795 [Nannocystis pusilla]|uniref:Uncharacterized protein n=1 Tax=Nannocystis pusilla TaxID=889268 RepID=A0A9X3J0X3_9BACT|nr:hypothetical protein [Nannocystis pusilla]MCY1009493.1 hypothetical protein [Nannocystis pusilla]